MRHFILTVCLLAINMPLYAQVDTSAYNTQRNKINQLLTERSEKFGRYDNSLTRRSGIFGLKTKKDMQASNDILTQIVLNDNDIFSELKILLDYKDFEKKEVENRAETVESRVDRFQLTITRLQQENDKIKAENDKLTGKNSKLVFYIIGLLVISLLLAFSSRLKKLLRTDVPISK